MSERGENTDSGHPVDYEEARQIAQTALEESDPEGRMVMQEEKSQERSFGWVFSYTTRKFLETGNFNHTIPGVGPLVVFRHDGSVEFLTTSLPPERLLKDIEERWNAAHGGAQPGNDGHQP